VDYANSVYSNAQYTYNTYHGREAPAWVSVPSASYVSHLRAAASAASGDYSAAVAAKEEAKSRLDAAKALAEQAQEDYQADAQTAKGRIEAAKQGVDAYSWWEGIYHSDVWQTIVRIAQVVAVAVAIVGMFVAGPVLLAIVAITSAIILVNGLMAWQAGDMTMGAFLLDLALTVIPMGKVLHGLKAIGKGVTRLGRAGQRLVNRTLRTAKPANPSGLTSGKYISKVRQAAGDAWKPPKKGNFNLERSFGEEQAVKFMEGQGWKRIDVSHGPQGIDSVFVKESRFLGLTRKRYAIVEAKFNTSQLSKLADGTPQMSRKWLTAGGQNSRIYKALGDPELAKRVTRAYRFHMVKPVLARTHWSGTVTMTRITHGGVDTSWGVRL
jgi:hypothetical protein